MAGDIPCLRIYSQGDAPKGIVVFYHGWTSTKELQSVRGHFLAAYGYTVLIPEAINHEYIQECQVVIVFSVLEKGFARCEKGKSAG